MRKHGNVSLVDGKYIFNRGSSISSDTYFNGFSIHKWKNNTSIKNITLRIRANGYFKIRVGVHKLGVEHYFIHEKIQHVSDEITLDIELLKLDDGILFFNIESLNNEGIFYKFDWVTNDEKSNHVKLALVITHFNRKEFAVPAIKKIQDKVASDNISLYVIDNSKNITHEEAYGSILIHNENYGGAGGFTRGLLEAKEDGHTHILFMDDDASCEPESLLRTYQFLSYAKSQDIAVSGALLRELEPHRMFEKGALFDGVCQPLKTNLDMRDVHHLLISELEDIRPDYGGWWFFAFSLEHIKHLAFPFFVRGDDLMFSMVNDFNIVTMNGISSWGDDFGLKNGPMPIYLDVRNHFVQMLTHLEKDKVNLIKTLRMFFYNNVYSYNYASSKAILKAVRDVQKGKDFWIENLDTSEIRKEINSYIPEEKMMPIKRSEIDFDYPDCNSESKFNTFVRKLTLNGYLLPKFMLKDRVIFQHKGFHANFKEIYRYKKILYEYEPNRTGYISCYSSKDFLKLSTLFEIEIMRIRFNYNSLKSEYRTAFNELTTEVFWTDKLKLKR